MAHGLELTPALDQPRGGPLATQGLRRNWDEPHRTPGIILIMTLGVCTGGCRAAGFEPARGYNTQHDFQFHLAGYSGLPTFAAVQVMRSWTTQRGG